MSCFQKGVLSLAALSVSAMSFAATDMETRVRELEKEMKEVRSQTAAKTYGAYATTARPENDGKGFFVTFDVLYWQSLVDGTEFTYNQGCNASNVYALPVNADVNSITFNKWDWGFRAGLGYKFDHGEWDVYGNFTYFKNSSDLTIGDGALTTILNDKIANNPIVEQDSVYFENVVSSFNFSFNRLDLELGRDFYVSKFLSMRPHVGLMTAWIKQYQTTKFTGGSVGYNTVSLTNYDKYWGIGPRTGINTQWHLCNGFSLIGNTSGAFVYGNFKLSKNQSYSLNEAENSYYLYSGIHRFSPTGQLQLGLKYDRYTTDCKQHFSAFLAWDVQYWWNLYRFLPADSIVSSNNDVSLQGATLNLRLDF